MPPTPELRGVARREADILAAGAALPRPDYRCDDERLEAALAAARVADAAADAAYAAALAVVQRLEAERLEIHQSLGYPAAGGRAQHEQERRAGRLGPLAAELQRAEAVREFARDEAAAARRTCNAWVQAREAHKARQRQAEQDRHAAARQAARRAAGIPPSRDRVERIVIHDVDAVARLAGHGVPPPAPATPPARRW